MTFPGNPLANQFTHPDLADDTLMHGAVDVQLNALRTASAAFGTGLAVFRAAQRATLALVNGAAVKFDTTVEDTAGNYTPTTGVYVIPGAGLYLCGFQLRQTTAVSFTAQFGGLPTATFPNGVRSSACLAGAGRGPAVPLVPLWFAGGETITVVPAFGGSVSLMGNTTNDQCFFSIAQVA